MKNSFSIFKRDIRNILKNYGAIIVILALCILPSLYAWFNIKASWDPYSEEATSGIKVGVISLDEGASLNGNNVNLGEDVVNELKDNKQMGWQFSDSEEEAIKMVEEGKYYAMITIPKDFSKNLISIVSEDVKKGEIIYSVNEKINAIAPKITDKGASSVQEKVNKTIVETVSDAIFGMGNEVGIELENQLPKVTTIYNALLEIQGNFVNIDDTVEKATEGAEKLKVLIEGIQQDVPLIEQTLVKSQDLGASLKEFLSTSKEGVNNVAPVVKKDLKLLSEIASDISSHAEALIDAINAGSANAPEIIDNLLSKLNGMNKTVDSIITLLNKLNKFKPDSSITETINALENVSASINSAISSLSSIRDNVSNGQTVDLTVLNNIVSVLNDVSSITVKMYDDFDSNILTSLNSIFDNAYEVADSALQVINEAEEKLPQVSEILNLVYEGVDNGVEGIEFVKEKLPIAEEMINDLVTKIGGINDSTDLMEIINILKADVQKRSEFLATPVDIIENKLFPMNNYGTGMTPFYSVLSLWVGLLLLASMLTPEVEGEYSSTAKYFGKLYLFLAIAIIQALIVSIGDLYILKIYCDNPLLFVIGCVFISCIFTLIVYSLLSVAENVGKVIAIILLVLQVAGSGGTFPIQLTPKFFQGLYPFLPFTYAISFAREAIGGVVTSVLTKDIAVLIIFGLAFLIAALVLKKPINKMLHGFNESMKKSGVGE